MKRRDRPAISKLITDDLIDIFGQNEQEILNFIGVTNEIEEYELRFTNSADIVNCDSFKTDGEGGEGEDEDKEKDEEIEIGEDDKELALAQIQTQEAEIAADINKYLKILKTKESLEFAQINRDEIFERLKCRCFDWHRIKKKETIKDVIRQICKAKTCREGLRIKEKEEKEIAKAQKLQKQKGKKGPVQYIKKMKKMGVCTGPISRRRKKSRKYTKKEIQELISMKEKLSRDTIRLDIKKLHSIVKHRPSRKDSSSSDESTATTTSQVTSHKQLIRAKDSVMLRKGELSKALINVDRSSTESSSTVSDNLQRLDSLEKIGKRKINPKMFNMYLNEFNSIKNYAFVFIDNILEEAESKVNVSIIDPFEVNIKDYICTEFICGEDETEPPSIPDKPISLYSEVYGYDLTPHEGKNMVRDVIKYWNLRKTWKHCINFLNKQTDSCSDYYNYEVKWSEPTFSYPVPQVTVSVFFTIELSRVKPTLFPPKVTFVFETERYKFTGYDDIAHEKFLDDILECKTAFFKSMHF